MENIRLPRFKRTSKIAPIRLTERDREIVRLVGRHRFLRSPQIVGLLSGGSQQLLRRLQLLYHHGYLERPRAQIDYYHQGGSRHIVYGLGNKGGTLLNQERGGASRSIHWGEKNRSVGRIFLEHALLVSDVMVAIELACRKSGRVRILRDEELLSNVTAKAKPFHWKVNINQGLRLGIVPDCVFGLEFSDQDGDTHRILFFLEADRGTMPVTRRNLSQTSFFRKLLAYQATWSQAIHRTRFGFNRFRVLTVTASASRVKSLVDACSRLETGQGLFLFTDQLSLKTAENVLSLVWKNGRQGETGNLLGYSNSQK